ncbi:2,3-diphosphoglycerate-dependent phosphoglycerate mutase [Aquisalinus flavus]|uniref:2,3-bisphosphoglycerate-dependent phosphoglycerate mutase n=1 Tax=Aquisalinus flavus TaxID=1526572 RepID=A0A8J2V4N1_9PROT|nr:2,3-diphosphoglycerate-dependent phosphoglycerate mutase [Aquisalinus flavus]MBD0426092.1 2,3-diphosphoglycerate-dependent phosphoglycerate mutase [Aquisalinus flavus]UNE48323.1 2,3-diphosphoglycerate-dependent phosphoglycerate mutase [Aquisalinus flavus]GGD10712.1 2,3-bisphosphoglycerate-dependent phosphoglycerate mutase [Aquisalinus flavus]
MTYLALVRHGQSAWNLENRFTGWVDVDLTDQGREEAAKAGELLAQENVEFAAAYTSVLSRAIRTLNIALDKMDKSWLPVTKDWRLNERHYGGLTGLNKAETAEKHGEEQVLVWRRSYDTPPPELDDATAFPSLTDGRYPAGVTMPKTESLKTTLDRVQPYWEADIAPRVKAGDNLIIAAHGNSLRALVKMLFNVSNDDIVGVEMPTGNPLLIELKDGSLEIVSARYLDTSRATEIPPAK